MKTNNLDKSLNDMMNAIRKITQQSDCIDIFGNLLNEINDIPHIKTVIVEMNQFIEYMSKLGMQIDKLNDIALKAQILTYEFIKPDRFFKNTLASTNNAILLNAAINANEFLNDKEKGAVFYDLHYESKLGKLIDPGKIKPNSIEAEVIYKRYEKYGYKPEELYDIKEDIRRIILLWNYCATIVKAILQTKRRSIGLDNNSKKFN